MDFIKTCVSIFRAYEENNAGLYFVSSINWCELVPVVMLVKESESPDFSLKRILCLGTVCAYLTQYDVFQWEKDALGQRLAESLTTVSWNYKQVSYWNSNKAK